MVWEALIILLLIRLSEKLFWLLSPHFQLTKISLDKLCLKVIGNFALQYTDNHNSYM